MNESIEAPPARSPGRQGAALIVAMVALATDMFVYGLAIPVLPAIAHREGAPAVAIGVLFACYAAAFIVVTPLAGAWADRAGLRGPMLVGLAGLAASTLLFAFGHGFAFLLLARFLQGAAAGVTWTASLALIAATHPPAARGRAMGTALSAVAVGTLAGPPVGGFLFQHLGGQAPFVAAAALAAVDGAARWALVPDLRESAQRLPPASRPPSAWRHADTPLLFVLTAFGAALIAFLEPILPLHAAAALGLRPEQVGLLFGIAALAGGTASPLAGALAGRVPALAVAAAGLLLGAAAMALATAVANPWALGVALALVACASALVLAPTLVLVARVAEAQQPPAYGASYGVYNLAYAAGLTAAPFLAGAAASALSFGGATGLAAMLLLVVGIGAAIRSLASRERA
jgi:MFS transporter, DHA1 family, solute carrier family 18 (vesicular amine transporter), member 1/2